MDGSTTVTSNGEWGAYEKYVISQLDSHTQLIKEVSSKLDAALMNQQAAHMALAERVSVLENWKHEIASRSADSKWIIGTLVALGLGAINLVIEVVKLAIGK